MKIYRLSREKYTRDLSGTGAMLNGGRWNSRGKYALYTAENISLAKLEVAVHLDFDLIPDDYYLIEIEMPDNATIQTIETAQLFEDWDSIPHSESTQRIGDEFLSSQEFLALKVPSAIVKQEFNYILNPAHTSYSQVKVTAIEPFQFDHRLFKR